MYLLLLTLSLVPSTYTAKILGICLFPSYSHQHVFHSIWQELSLRGHELKVLTPRPVAVPDLINLTQIDISFKFTRQKYAPKHLVSKEISRIEDMYNMFQMTDYISENTVNQINFKKFVSNSTEDFDLIIMDCYYPALFDLSRIFTAPIICLSSFGGLTVTHDIIGNPSHPILYTDYLITPHEKIFPFLERIQLLVYHLWVRLWYHFVVRPHGQYLAESFLGNERKDLAQLERHVKMLFLNVNPVLYDRRPNAASVMELGLLGIKSSDLLPADVQEFLDGAKQGAVYLSFGSAIQIQGTSLGERILEGLAKLPYKVVLKWKCDAILPKFGNILCKEWLPQTKILEHPNLKVFVTQGGLHSVEEAIIAQVPLVGIPIWVDQPMNAHKFSQQGIGEVLDPLTLTPDQLKECVMKVAENSKYRKRIIQARQILLDNPMSSFDKFAWWIEYVIRHKGASHLSSPNLEISWFSYLLGDVFLVFVAALIFTFWCSWRVWIFLQSLYKP